MLDKRSRLPRPYRAFLLRMWQEAPGQPWRVLLQDANTQERHGFADLDRLLVFLHTQTDQGCGSFPGVETQENGEAHVDDIQGR